MKKYYIEHACGNFSAPIEYAEKAKTEIKEDILAECPEFMTIATFNSEDEARKEYSKYYDDIDVQENCDRAIISYHIYRLESEDKEV